MISTGEESLKKQMLLKVNFHVMSAKLIHSLMPLLSSSNLSIHSRYVKMEYIIGLLPSKRSEMWDLVKVSFDLHCNIFMREWTFRAVTFFSENKISLISHGRLECWKRNMKFRVAHHP